MTGAEQRLGQQPDHHDERDEDQEDDPDRPVQRHALSSDRDAQPNTSRTDAATIRKIAQSAREVTVRRLYDTTSEKATIRRRRRGVASDVGPGRLLALMNFALADATIGIWNAKNHFDSWRPVTAIRALIDPTWAPILATPAFQEYPSAHSGVSDAAASVLASFYGNDTGFTVTSAGLPGVQRDFTSFSAAVLQIEDARIYAGFHFRFSVVDGATLGAEVAQYILENTALPIHGRDLGQLGRP